MSDEIALQGVKAWDLKFDAEKWVKKWLAGLFSALLHRYNFTDSRSKGEAVHAVRTPSFKDFTPEDFEHFSNQYKKYIDRKKYNTFYGGEDLFNLSPTLLPSLDHSNNEKENPLDTSTNKIGSSSTFRKRRQQ